MRVSIGNHSETKNKIKIKIKTSHGDLADYLRRSMQENPREKRKEPRSEEGEELKRREKTRRESLVNELPEGGVVVVETKMGDQQVA